MPGIQGNDFHDRTGRLHQADGKFKSEGGHGNENRYGNERENHGQNTQHGQNDHHDIVGHDRRSGVEVFEDRRGRAHEADNGRFVAEDNVRYD